MRRDDPLFPLLIPLSLPSAAVAANPDWAEWLGIVALGPRLSGKGFSRDDRALLLTLADQLGLALFLALTPEKKP